MISILIVNILFLGKWSDPTRALNYQAEWPALDATQLVFDHSGRTKPIIHPPLGIARRLTRLAWDIQFNASLPKGSSQSPLPP